MSYKKIQIRNNPEFIKDLDIRPSKKRGYRFALFKCSCGNYFEAKKTELMEQEKLVDVYIIEVNIMK